jgi:hypothetical protein
LIVHNILLHRYLLVPAATLFPVASSYYLPLLPTTTTTIFPSA